MALTYGFYNSVDGDRTYDAIQMGQIFDGIITDGVYATFLKAMVVKASENASEVIVQPGRCWFNHTWTYIDADYPVEAPAPEVILDRVDALVIDINSENAFRENSLIWVQGTPSSLNPERPTLIKSVTHNQYPLCYVYRKAGTTMIYAADITNAVGTSETPFVTGVLTGINIDDLLSQWDDEFHTWEAATKTSFEAWMVNQQSVYVTWFNSIKDQMEGDLTDFEAWFETIRGIIDEEAATHLQAEIDELKDMLPAGSHIDVSTTEPTLFNRNVTVSDGVHSKTVQFDASGAATVESFPYIGIISVTSTDGTRTAEESINIPYFGRYSAVLAFWSATVSLLGDETLAALPVTVRDSNGDVVAIVTLNASGQGTFTATKPDTYKFIYTYGGQTMEVSLAVTQETTYEVEIHGGFRFDQWLIAGRVEEEFDTLDEILADEPTLRQLFLVHDSVDYICNTFSTGSLTDVTKIFNTDLAAKWINLSDYALDHFYAVEGIKSIMDEADKYGYGEWCLMPQVPTMTSNTAPYGTVSATFTPYDSSHDLYKAFDNDDSSFTYANDVGGIGYDFLRKVSLKYARVKTVYANMPLNVQFSDDNSTWSDASNYEVTVADTFVEIPITETYAHRYWRIHVDMNRGSGQATNFYIKTIQFYAWAPKGNVPVMTNVQGTAPYGKSDASASASGYESYRAFDGSESTEWVSGKAGAYPQHIQYGFVNPVCVKKFRVNFKSNATSSTYVIQGSNDNSNYVDLSDSITDATGIHEHNINNDNYYLYYRLKITAQTFGSSSTVGQINSLQFYGRELKVSVPVMTSNTAPYGEASAQSNYSSSYAAYMAFRNNTERGWTPASFGHHVLYNFKKSVVLKTFALYRVVGYDNLNATYKLKGSNDGTNWTYIDDPITTTIARKWLYYSVNNNTPYEQYAVEYVSNNADISAGMGILLQFYGLDYSEKEFEVGTNKKWLYDHGVELEVFTKNLVGSGSVAENDGYSLNMRVPASSQRCASMLAGIDLTPYNLFRGVIDDEYSGASHLSWLLVYGTATPSYNTNADAATTSVLSSTNRYTAALNVSAFNETKYVGSRAVNNSESSIKYIKISELWLE